MTRISGVLRLAKKYMVDTLWNKAVQILERDWPNTLDAWLEADEASKSFQKKAYETIDFYDEHASFDICEHWPDPGTYSSRNSIH